MSTARQPDTLLSWMDSLADLTRLRLLRLLERHELGVAELCAVLQMPQSTVSRHLKVLADEGWIKGRAQGTTNLYRMSASAQEPAARRLWQLAREQMEGWATASQDQLRLEQHLAAREPAAQAFFAGAAGEWDRLRSELYGSAFTQHALLALVPAHWTVADLGCGTGQLTSLLSPCVASVIGVDQSGAMLRTARRRTSGLRNVELRQGELEALPIDDGACDAALMVLALSYVDDWSAAVHEMARILRPGGRAVIVDLLRHDRDDFREQMGQRHAGFDPDRLVSALTGAGLAEAAARPLPPEPAAKGPALLLASATRPARNGSSRSNAHKGDSR